MPKTSRFGRLFFFLLMLLMLAYERPNRAGAVPVGLERKLWSVYWTVEPGFTSTLEMKNNRALESLTAHVSLYFERGEEYELAPILLGPRQTVVLSLNDVMNSLPSFVTARGSKEGTAEVRFDASNASALMGSISVVNPTRGIGWNFPFYAVNPLVPVAPVRGLFWFPDKHTDGFVAVHNSSEQMMTVIPSFQIATEKHVLEAVSLAPGQGYKLELRKELNKLGLHDISAGGIEFNYQGARDALKAHGVLFDDRGFSAEVDFHRLDKWTEPLEFMLRTPRFAIGSADPALGLSSGTIFNPYVVLHNFNGHPLDITMAVNFNQGQAPQEIPLAVSLSPGETRVLSLVDQLAGQIPAGVSWGSLELCYTDRHNGVAAMLVSRSQDGKHSMRSVLNWVHGSMSEGWLWRADGEYNTLIGLLNTDTEEARAAVSLSYYVNGQGYNYELPEVTIPARTSHLVNVGDVVAAGVPDRDGEVIPSTARFGGYSVRKVGRRIHTTLITETLVFDRRNATFVSYYNTCCALQDPFVLPGSFFGPVGFTGQNFVQAWNNCSGTWINITSSGNYSSSNSAVATVGGTTGSVSGVGAGTANINTFLEYYAATPPPENLNECPLDTNCVPPCTLTVFTNDTGAEVVPTVTIDSFSPNPILQGSSASVHVTVNPSATITLTITGSGTGRATFGSSGSTTMQISGTTTVSIRGDVASTSGAVDLTLSASYAGSILDTAGFSVTSGACTAASTGHSGDGSKNCPAQVELLDTYTITNYCIECQISCISINFDGTFTPGTCGTVTTGIAGSANRTLTSTQTGNFTSTDCNFHPVEIQTRVRNAQGTTTTIYTGGSFGLKCNSLPNGSPCP